MTKTDKKSNIRRALPPKKDVVATVGLDEDFDWRCTHGMQPWFPLVYRSGQRTDANSVKDHNNDIVSLHPFSFSSFLSRVIRLIRWFGVVLLTLTEGGRGWTFSQKRRIRSCSSARILVRPPPPPFPLPPIPLPPTTTFATGIFCTALLACTRFTTVYDCAQKLICSFLLYSFHCT